MTQFRPLFRTVRADGATCSLALTENDTWVLLLDQTLIDTGPTAGGGVEEAVDKFRALVTGTPERKFARACSERTSPIARTQATP